MATKHVVVKMFGPGSVFADTSREDRGVQEWPGGVERKDARRGDRPSREKGIES